jgi:hypothetical protein
VSDIGTPEIVIESWANNPKGAFEHLLCRGGALVLVNTSTHLSLILPKHLTGNVMLDYDDDPNMPIPIPDLEATDAGIFATLSFDRTPCKTFVPWSAVLAMAPKRAEMVRPRVSEGPDGSGKKRHLKLV